MTIRLLLASSLLVACAASQPGDSDVTGGAGGKADDDSSFQPTFCGVNILESAGPVFVNEVCMGGLRSPDVVSPALRVTYTDGAVEIYGIDVTPTAAVTLQTVTAHRGDGELHDLPLTLRLDEATGELVPAALRGAVDRGLSFDAPLAAWTGPAPRVTCFLNRRASVPGGEQRVQASFAVGSEDTVSSNGLDAFEGNYSFDLTPTSASELEVTFYENNHVQDETGRIQCSLDGVARGTSFCQEPIEIDANLGTGDDTARPVHAFNFWCRLN